MEDRANHKTSLVQIRSSLKPNAIRKVLFFQGQFCLILLILFLAAVDRPTPVPSIVMSPSTSVAITFTVNRSDAYYLGSIPAPNSRNLLSFNWTIIVSDLSSGQGSIQFSHENVTWSNLASFAFVSGEAQGKQSIDSTWAGSGTNYLRVSYWESSIQYLSPQFTLKVFINYGTTMLVILLPFVAVAGVGLSIYFVRKRNRQSTALTQ